MRFSSCAPRYAFRNREREIWEFLYVRSTLYSSRDIDKAVETQKGTLGIIDGQLELQHGNEKTRLM